MLFWLLILLTFLLIVNYFSNKQEMLAPSILFTVAFLFSCSWAYAFSGKWNLNLHVNTFMVIFGGVLEFSIVSKVFKSVYSGINPINVSEDERKNYIDYKIAAWKVLLLGLFVSLTIFYTIYSLRRIEPADSLSESVALYRAASIDPVKKLSLVGLPGILGKMREVSDALAYFLAFILSRRVILFHKVDWNCLIVFVLCLIDSLLLGYRTTAFSILIATLVYVYFILRKANRISVKSNLKVVAVFSAIFITLAVIFQLLASTLGRDVSSYSMLDYLSIYLGAEIKNLDVFLQNGIFPVKNTVFGSQTFVNLISSIGKYMDVKPYTLDIPFLSVGRYNLGNVYTTFYAYIYDFGYTGVVVLVGMMAVISQYVFEKVERFSISSNKVPVSLLVYGLMAVSLLLSFFSNKFYEDVFSTRFLRLLIYWFLLDWVLLSKKKKEFF